MNESIFNSCQKPEQSNINISEDRKRRTELFLKEQGIPYNPNLPPIQSEDDVNMKTPEKILKRALCAFLTANIGCDFGQSGNLLDSVDFFNGILKKFELENELTSDEKQLFNYDGSYKIGEQFIVEITWRMERCMPLFWACGFVDGQLDYPASVSNTEFMVPIIMECEDFSSLMKKVTVKSLSEILDNADVLYRMDWACVDARIKGMSSPAGLDAEVVVEQHKGFNWIIGAYASDDWDNISADT